jgi:hypothetical protein
MVTTDTREANLSLCMQWKHCLTPKLPRVQGTNKNYARETSKLMRKGRTPPNLGGVKAAASHGRGALTNPPAILAPFPRCGH